MRATVRERLATFADMRRARGMRSVVSYSPVGTRGVGTSSQPGVATLTPIGTALVAAEALALRGVPAAGDVSNPLGGARLAAERAHANAVWWARLTADQRRAVVETYPYEVGNAEGVATQDRDRANRIVLQRLRDHADQIQTELDELGWPNRTERRLLERVNNLDLALRKAGADARRAGFRDPLLLAFDPQEFGGDGRVVLGFGVDPYRAESVSWHVPGVRTTMHSLLGFHSRCALLHLQSTLQEAPELAAASIAWVGYDTPSGWGIRHAAGHRLARAGGAVLAADVCAFNAAHDTWAADGSRFTGNHLFGYSYGSTVTGYAGCDARLADQVDTITLIGSPGVGPQRHASDFGIGTGRIFVASSSGDVIAALGGRVPGSSGRLLGRGLGMDPAAESFGAVRISAEFPAGMSRPYTGGTHHAYYLRDPSTDPPIRSESLRNLGRIAAGRMGGTRIAPQHTADG